MKKKLFVISDIHNNYQAMIDGLNEAGFDENNPSHLLIVCGDMFDRKPGYAVAVYEYLKKLTDKNKAIVIRGNHCSMIQSYMDGNSISPFNYLHNGTNETLADFWHRTAPFESWCALEGNCDLNTETFAQWLEIVRKDINEEYPEFLPWLKSLPYYYETKNYIFTHGMINGQCEDWHNPPEGWYLLTWSKPIDFYEGITNTDKKVVVGHINCSLLRSLISQDENDNSIFERPDGKVIGIDTCTPLTKKVNVLVLEDELI